MLVVGLVAAGIYFKLPDWRRDTLLSRYRLGADESAEEFQRGHFHFVCAQASRPQAEELASGLERYVEGLIGTFGAPLKIEPETDPVTLYLFESGDQLRDEYQRRYRASLSNNGGFYNPLLGEIVIVAGEQLSASAFHEVGHMVLDRWVVGKRGRWTRWLDEGLATYFEKVVEQQGRLKWGDLDPQALREGKSLIANQRWLTVDELGQATEGDFRRRENSRYYTQSYLLVHFLLHAGQGAYRDGFLRYYDLERLGDLGRTSPARLAGALSMSSAQLDRSWRAYVLGQDE